VGFIVALPNMAATRKPASLGNYFLMGRLAASESELRAMPLLQRPWVVIGMTRMSSVTA